MLKLIQGNMLQSQAHVFVYVLGTHQNNGMPDIQAPFGRWPEGLFEKACEVMNAVAKDKQPGRLWVYPLKLNWPDRLAQTPNGLTNRTVWCALIPQAPENDKAQINSSLELLASWIKATKIPLRIAAYNNGQYYRNTWDTRARSDYNALLENHLGEWDIEVYED